MTFFDIAIYKNILSKKCDVFLENANKNIGNAYYSPHTRLPTGCLVFQAPNRLHQNSGILDNTKIQNFLLSKIAYREHENAQNSEIF